MKFSLRGEDEGWNQEVRWFLILASRENNMVRGFYLRVARRLGLAVIHVNNKISDNLAHAQI